MEQMQNIFAGPVDYGRLSSSPEFSDSKENPMAFIRVFKGRLVILTASCIGRAMAQTSDGDVMTWAEWSALPVAR